MHFFSFTQIEDFPCKTLKEVEKDNHKNIYVK